MGQGSSAELEAPRLNAAARLGPALGPAAPFARIPLRYYAGSLILLAVGLVALAAFSFSSSHPTFLLVLAAILLLPAAAFLVPWVFWGGSLTVHQRGAVVARRGRETIFAFAEIESIALQDREQLEDGKRVGLLRKVTLRAASAKASFRSLALDGRPDPVGAFVGQLLDGAAQAFEARLGEGAVLRGRGWSLDARGLSAGGEPVPLGELSASGVFEGCVSVWRGDEERPFLATLVGSANALLLERLVAKRLQGRPARQRASDPSSLGRMLLERNDGPVIAVAIAVIGLAVMALGWQLSKSVTVAAWISGAVLVSLLAGAFSRQRTAAHERGIIHQGPFGTRKLRYDQMDRLSYAATRQFQNGVYTGTEYQLRCGAPGSRRIGLRSFGRGTEGNLDGLRDQIAASVARRMREALARDGSVAWTGGMHLTPEGVRFRKSKFMGSGPEVFRRWAEHRFKIEGGFFFLYEPGTAKPALGVSCASENFYPGYLLFEALPRQQAGQG